MIYDWFLLFSLFFPRICLIIAWVSGSIPPNNTPFILDFLLAIIFPRVLILFYIYTNMGFHPWFWIHLIVIVLFCCFGGSSKSEGN